MVDVGAGDNADKSPFVNDVVLQYFGEHFGLWVRNGLAVNDFDFALHQLGSEKRAQGLILNLGVEVD
jgi:hypothetical protein